MTHRALPLCFTLAILAAPATRPLLAAGSLRPARLRCEHRENPLGIDAAPPRLSWIVESDRRGARQSAYRVLVASRPERLAAGDGDLWDSGWVESGETVLIPYGGKELHSGQHCYWKVRVRDSDGEPSRWSAAAHWSMGLLREADWHARYISYRDETPIHRDRGSLFLPPARQYRREFSTGPKAVRRATLTSTALGIYELHLNGTRVGDERFLPGWSDYHRRAYTSTHDVTSLLRAGPNALGAWVADGWYSGYVGFGLLTGIGTERIGRYIYGKTPSVLLQLEIEYEDGTRQRIVTDESWKVTGEGPIREADLLMGETYDARRETPGWDRPGFDDRDWEPVILAAEAPPAPATFYEFRNPEKPGEGPRVEGREVDLRFHRPKLEAFPGVPVRITGELPARRVSEPEPGRYVFDLGQNFAGTIRLRVRGPAGRSLTLRYGEMLHPDGRLMTENLRRARATDRYVLRGDERGETYVPRFTFHGFRYVEVSGLGEKPSREAVTGLVLHSDTPLTSTFSSSDPMVDRLFENVRWTQRANFIDLPTDCPQRDERMGWTGDAQAYVWTATFNADVSAFYQKWLRELMDSQRPSGVFPGYAPFPFQHGWDFGTAWCDAGTICPWTIWQAYGDTGVIERSWEPMVRFLRWRERSSRDRLGVVHGNNWGDWLAQEATKTPLDFIDTVYFAHSARLMADMAEASGRAERAAARRHYRRLRGEIEEAFARKYLSESGRLTVPTQTACALALELDLVPERFRATVGRQLVERIRQNGNRLGTGFLGTRVLLPALSKVGATDLAVFLLQSHAFPSWGYEIDQGATTIWERWDSYTLEEGFGRHNAAMNSFSHYAFGAVLGWVFDTLVGIDSDGPGYRRIVIRPTPPRPGSNAERRPIDRVAATYDSVRGEIAVAWRVLPAAAGANAPRDFELEVTIPANTTATVHLPARDAASVREGGAPIEKAEGVRLLRQKEKGRVVLSVGAGRYRFLSRAAIEPAPVAYRTSEPPDRSVNPEG